MLIKTKCLEEPSHTESGHATPAEALRAATRNPAFVFGLSDSLGTVEAGKIADLTLLEADPLPETNRRGGFGRERSRPAGPGSSDCFLKRVGQPDSLKHIQHRSGSPQSGVLPSIDERLLGGQGARRVGLLIEVRPAALSGE